MNCIWEIVLKAQKSGYNLEELRFRNSESPSPYTVFCKPFFVESCK